MVMVLLKEKEINIMKCVNDKEFKILENAGVNKEDTSFTTSRKISLYLCYKYQKGAVFMIEDDNIELEEIDKKIIKIYNHMQGKWF